MVSLIWEIASKTFGMLILVCGLRYESVCTCSGLGLIDVRLGGCLPFSLSFPLRFSLKGSFEGCFTFSEFDSRGGAEGLTFIDWRDSVEGKESLTKNWRGFLLVMKKDEPEGGFRPGLIESSGSVFTVSTEVSNLFKNHTSLVCQVEVYKESLFLLGQPFYVSKWLQ